MMRQFYIFVLTLLGFWGLLLGFSVKAEETDQPAFDAPAQHAIAIEVSTGKILYEKDSQALTGVSSITKLLTAYLVYEALEADKIKMDTPVTISNYAYNLTFDTSIPNVPLDARSYTVEQLLNAMLVASSNSATIALAEEIGGTEPKFVDKMLAKLEEWGITDAKLVNATGLPNNLLGGNIYPDSASTDENMMSARTVAIIARRLLQDFPQITDISSQISMTWNGQPVPNWNYLLEGAAFSRTGVNGLITGTSLAYGSSLVASGKENDMSVITVILNADNSDTDSSARFTTSHSLLDYISENYYLVTLLKKGQAYDKSSVAVLNGKSKTLSAVAKSDLNVVQKAGDENTKARFESDKTTYEAPVTKQEKIGKLTFQDEGYLDSPPSVTMVAQTTVERSIFFKVWWNTFVTWVNEEL